MKKVLFFILLGVLSLTSVVLYNTFTFESLQMDTDALPPAEELSVPTEAIHHLAEAIPFQTISHYDTSTIDYSTFEGFHQYLESTYPLLHQHLKKEIVNGYSLLYTWKGSDQTLAPLLLAAHMDVVPVEEATLSNWKQGPWSGNIHDDYLWGRGSIDDKNAIIAIMEAVELQLSKGITPKRTIYLAFGHDEETRGSGAMAMAELLKQRGVRVGMAVDEGGMVSKGIVPGIEESQVALIGSAEKGAVTLKLSTKMEAGHSSMPSKENSIEVISQAILKLQETPMEDQLSLPVKGFLRYLGPEMPFVLKMAMANQWLFEPIILDNYRQSNTGRASIRTTHTPTIFNSGIKENVIPSTAEATINFRILPGETVKDVVNHATKVIDDKRVSISTVGSGKNPSNVSPDQGEEFNSLRKTIHQIYPTTISTPFLLIAATDGRYYETICDHVYRFSPTHYTGEDLDRLHGINERIALSDFEESIRFYYQLMVNY
ncbi:M20 family peptidase [Algivirga pacifica]|uniref:M20 family peptidase n=1 Tax=Algivirga pacifica TaxID=1162670 RepID=A0ABP9D9T4_9BACT